MTEVGSQRYSISERVNLRVKAYHLIAEWTDNSAIIFRGNKGAEDALVSFASMRNYSDFVGAGDDTYDRLATLTGPHGRTLFKAWLARQSNGYKF